jgi:hypothetical protein
MNNIIRVIKIDELPFRLSTDNIEFNIDIIKKYMKDNNSNTLYLLNNPYENRFSINNDNLTGLIKGEIYCMVNLDDKQLQDSKTNQQFQDKNTKHNNCISDSQFYQFICEEESRIHIFSKTLKKVNKNMTQLHENISEKYKHIFDN